MSYQRAIVKGLLLDAVQTRSMYTADISQLGLDTDVVLWTTYLEAIYVPLEPLLAMSCSFSNVELQQWDTANWVTYDEIPFVYEGSLDVDAITNAVAPVIIGKAIGLHHIGRKYFSGLAETYQAGNHLNDTALAAFVGIVGAYILPFTGENGGTLAPGVMDKFGVFHRFISGYLSSFFGSIRRRKPGNGM